MAEYAVEKRPARAIRPLSPELSPERRAPESEHSRRSGAPLRVAQTRCMHVLRMPNVQVRDVPDEVHEALVRRAAQAGQSLQQFLAAQLAAIAATPTIDDMLERIERRPKGRLSARSAIDAIDTERARR